MSVDQILQDAYSNHQEGRLTEAEALYRSAIELEPDRWSACLNLTKILLLAGQFEQATRWLRWRLEDNPDDVVAHRQLGFAYASHHELGLALMHFQRVAELEPRDAGAHEIIAHLLKGFGREDESRKNFLRSAALRDPFPIGIRLGAPAFRALFVFAPDIGNTPYVYLTRYVRYDCRLMNFVADVDYDVEALRASTDVVVNLIADGDRGATHLSQASELLARIGKPVINEPSKIAGTDRASVALRLANIDGCAVPRTLRYASAELTDPHFDLAATSLGFPVLIRRVGTHGGEDFARVENDAQLRSFISQTPAPHYYLSEYTDYRSADGYFRKYRFIFVNGEVLPYHLAIDDQWKIHHATTDMVNQQWMQDEERAFLERPHEVFGERQYAVLHAIRNALDLDYSGVDCALDQHGRVVLFEANASMLVHTRNEAFPYKNPAVRRIKEAFDAMLESKAALAR